MLLQLQVGQSFFSNIWTCIKFCNIFRIISQCLYCTSKHCDLVNVNVKNTLPLRMFLYDSAFRKKNALRICLNLAAFHVMKFMFESFFPSCLIIIFMYSFFSHQRNWNWSSGCVPHWVQSVYSLAIYYQAFLVFPLQLVPVLMSFVAIWPLNIA